MFAKVKLDFFMLFDSFATSDDIFSLAIRTVGEKFCLGIYCSNLSRTVHHNMILLDSAPDNASLEE